MNKGVTRNDFLSYAKHSDELLQLEKRIKEHAKENRKKKYYCANNAWVTSKNLF